MPTRSLRSDTGFQPSDALGSSGPRSKPWMTFCPSLARARRLNPAAPRPKTCKNFRRLTALRASAHGSWEFRLTGCFIGRSMWFCCESSSWKRPAGRPSEEAGQLGQGRDLEIDRWGRGPWFARTIIPTGANAIVGGAHDVRGPAIAHEQHLAFRRVTEPRERHVEEPGGRLCVADLFRDDDVMDQTGDGGSGDAAALNGRQPIGDDG